MSAPPNIVDSIFNPNDWPSNSGYVTFSYLQANYPTNIYLSNQLNLKYDKAGGLLSGLSSDPFGYSGALGQFNGLVLPPKTITVPGTTLTINESVIVSQTTALTLPAVTGAPGQVYLCLCENAGGTVVSSAAGDTIAGGTTSTTLSMSSSEGVTLSNDGESAWFVVAGGAGSSGGMTGPTGPVGATGPSATTVLSSLFVTAPALPTLSGGNVTFATQAQINGGVFLTGSSSNIIWIAQTGTFLLRAEGGYAIFSNSAGEIDLEWVNGAGSAISPTGVLYNSQSTKNIGGSLVSSATVAVTSPTGYSLQCNYAGMTGLGSAIFASAIQIPTAQIASIGPTGPQGFTGPAGIQGPTGPTGSNASAVYAYSSTGMSFHTPITTNSLVYFDTTTSSVGGAITPSATGSIFTLAGGNSYQLLCNLGSAVLGSMSTAKFSFYDLTNSAQIPPSFSINSPDYSSTTAADSSTVTSITTSGPTNVAVQLTSISGSMTELTNSSVGISLIPGLVGGPTGSAGIQTGPTGSQGLSITGPSGSKGPTGPPGLSLTGPTGTVLPAGTNYGDYLHWNGTGAFVVGSTSVALGSAAGVTSQGSNSVAIGYDAGSLNQGAEAVAIGYQAAYTAQASTAIALGYGAAYTGQATNAIAIGAGAAGTNQATNAIAIGGSAGGGNQGARAVAIGQSAGMTGQGINAISIGYNSGGNQSQNAISIGSNAGALGQSTGSIILSAGKNLGDGGVAGIFISPVRNDNTAFGGVGYNTTTNELTYNTTTLNYTPSLTITSTGYIGLVASTGGVRIDRQLKIGDTATGPAASLQVLGNMSGAFWGVNGIGARFDASTYLDTSSAGTVGSIAAYSFGVPTFNASSGTTYPHASTVYIAGPPPQLGTNVTIQGPYALYVNGPSYFSDTLTFGAGEVGVGTLNLNGSASLINAQYITQGYYSRSQPQWSNTGAYMAIQGGTATDTSTAASGTAAAAAFNSFATPVLAASHTSVTTTKASNVYIDGAPTAGTNQTITNAYALYVNTGAAYFGSPVDYGVNTSTTASSGAASLPAAPAGFVNITLGGSPYRIPYYSP